MLDFSWGELVIVGIVALIAIGPKELPGVLRALGKWMGKIRRMASDFQSQFQDALREAEVADLKKQVDDLSSAASDVTSFDPLSDMTGDLERDIESKLDNLDKPGPDGREEDEKSVQASPDSREPESKKAATPAAEHPDDKNVDLAVAAPKPKQQAGGAA